MEKEKIHQSVEIFNKKASYEYHFLENYTSGIVLTGTEIKSIRQNKVNIQDAFCYVANQEVFVKNMHISPYGNGTYLNHNPLRERKLLLKKSEIKKISKSLDDQGITLIPTKLFTTQRGFVKLNIALAKGKKLHDKRQDIKEKDLKREMDIKFK